MDSFRVGQIWLLLDFVGFGWIWLDLGADSYGFLSSISSVMEGFSWIIKGLG